MRKFGFGILLILMIFLVSCGGGGGSGSSGSGSSADSGTEKFSTADYNALSNEQKYAVTNKMMATLYKGTSAQEFFDLSQGMNSQVSGNNSNSMVRMALADNSNSIAGIEAQLSQPLEDLDSYLNEIDEKYQFDSGREPLQYPLAMLFELPLSSDYYEIWIAYKLMNTILFSPALELETMDYPDIQKIFSRLIYMLAEDYSIGDIVYEHMATQENWRRFRSPEDNTREMMEIFLKRFKDEEVPLASTACKNWALTDDSDGYQLIIGFDRNTEPLTLLNTTVVDCYDFYRAVAEHPSLVPAVTARVVDVFFPGYSDEQKAEVVESVVSTNPATFKQLFSTIIFSKEYLLDNERPLEFEEAFFNIAHRINWYAYRNFFKYINRQYKSSSTANMYQMNQAAMTYKLGKPLDVPLDTLSFSYYHKSIREQLFLDRKTDPFNIDDGGWQAEFIDVNMDQDDFIDYLFLSVLSRTADPNELEELNAVIAERYYDRPEKKMEQAMIVLDYLSRLSELYYTPSFN